MPAIKRHGDKRFYDGAKEPVDAFGHPNSQPLLGDALRVGTTNVTLKRTGGGGGGSKKYNNHTQKYVIHQNYKTQQIDT